MIICIFLSGKKIKNSLFIDVVANISLLILQVNSFSWVYGGGKTFSYLVLGNYANGEIGSVRGILNYLGIELFIPFFGALMAVTFISVGVVAWLNMKNDLMYDIGNAELRIHIRLRSLIIIGWCVVNIAVLVLSNLGIGV